MGKKIRLTEKEYRTLRSQTRRLKNGASTTEDPLLASLDKAERKVKRLEKEAKEGWVMASKILEELIKVNGYAPTAEFAELMCEIKERDQ